jgi:hypothetical protein
MDGQRAESDAAESSSEHLSSSSDTSNISPRGYQTLGNKSSPSPQLSKNASSASSAASEPSPPSSALTQNASTEEPKSWDDIGRRLVEARKALDIASKADQKAAEELAAAQQRKQQTGQELKKHSLIVNKLAMEFTELAAAALEPPKVQMLAPRAPVPSSLMQLARPKPAVPSTEFNPFTGSRSLKPAPPTTSSSSNLLRVVRPSEPPAEEPLARSQPSMLPPQRSSRGEGGDDAEKRRTRVFAEAFGGEEAVRASSAKKKNSYGRSLFRGVRKVLSDGSFEARISVNGQDLLLGRYPAEEDAAKAYDSAVRKYRSPKEKSAVLNFPSEEDRALGWRSTFEQA